MSGNTNLRQVKAPVDVEVMEQLLKAETFDLKLARKVCSTPRCWKPGCYENVPFFQCKTCERSFHRKCVFELGDVFPEPVFDASKELAEQAKYGEVGLQKCPICRIVAGEGSEVEKDPVELSVQLKKLIELLNRETTDVQVERKNLLEPIREKVAKNEYKTVDHFMVDVRQIEYEIACSFSAYSGTGIRMIKAVDVLDISASVLRSCIQCFSGFVDDEGGLVDLAAFVATSTRRCEKPHLLLWVKEPGFQHWPSKVFATKDNFMYFISLRDHKSALRRMSLNEDRVVIREFTRSFLKKELKVKSKDKRRTQGIKDAQEYLEMYWPQDAAPAGKGSPGEDLRDQFRSIRLESSPEGMEGGIDKTYDGNYEAALQRMRYEWELPSIQRSEGLAGLE